VEPSSADLAPGTKPIPVPVRERGSGKRVGG
jgi:hypothetical protein